jgi:hypothetical protein
VFEPFGGTDISTDDWINVTVTCLAPDKPDKYYNGTIKVCNSDNLTDSCEIYVDLTTPNNKAQETLAVKFLLKYPILFTIIRGIFDRLGQ